MTMHTRTHAHTQIKRLLDIYEYYEAIYNSNIKTMDEITLTMMDTACLSPWNQATYGLEDTAISGSQSWLNKYRISITPH